MLTVETGVNYDKFTLLSISDFSIKLSDTPGTVRSLAPVPGEHTEEILEGLGYSKQKISQLRRDGVTG